MYYTKGFKLSSVEKVSVELKALGHEKDMTRFVVSGDDVGSLWLLGGGREGDQGCKLGSYCRGPGKEIMQMWIQAKGRGWREGERVKKYWR